MVREIKDAVLVPAEAIANGGVQLVEAGIVQRVEVKTGVRGARMVEIVGGLEVGRTVVSPARADLKSGARVRTNADGKQ